LLKDVGGEVLYLGPVLNTASNVGVNAVEILFIKLRKAARILLSSLD
jgi:hypothetical protein